MIALKHCWYMTERQIRNLARQPWYIGFTLVQRIIWLLLYSELFKRIVELPGFNTGSYLVFLTPGVVVMTALFSGGWSGMGVITDLDRGVLDRFLVSPAHRSALIAGRLIHLAAVTVIQSLILVGLAMLRGARFPGGVAGVAVLIGCAILLSVPFGALSSGMALLVRKEESVIGAVNFLLLPLTFLASVFMQQDLMPRWMQRVAGLNPVNWTVEASRTALSAQPDWGLILSRAAYLAVLTIICGWLAMRAFQAYQRSV
jgi:ABC-2 type transport system permease protein